QGQARGAGREGGWQRVEEDLVRRRRRSGRIQARESRRTRRRGLGRGTPGRLPVPPRMSDWQPSGSLDALRLRGALNAAIRSFLSERDVLEVETPVLSMAGNTEPNIASFSLEFTGRTEGAPRTRWLRTSPEHPLKRLLAAGLGDCY